MASFTSRERAIRVFGELVDRDHAVALVAHGPSNDTFKSDGTRRDPQRYFLQVEELFGFSSRRNDKMSALLEYLDTNDLEWAMSASETRATVSGLVVRIGEK